MCDMAWRNSMLRTSQWYAFNETLNMNPKHYIMYQNYTNTLQEWLLYFT